jgi:hypothetical protein
MKPPRAALPQAAFAGLAILACWTGPRGAAPARAGEPPVATADAGDLARKAEIMHGERWRRAIAEFGAWLNTQTIYPAAEVQRIKSQFNDRVAVMSSSELELLLDSLGAKIRLLDTAEARDAKAWLGEYLLAMSDNRRAAALSVVPNLLDLNAAQLGQEIQRIDRLRATLEQRRQSNESGRSVLADRAAANRQATAAASQAAAARLRSAPAHSPYRQGGSSPPFSDIERRRPLVGIGFFGPFFGF